MLSYASGDVQRQAKPHVAGAGRRRRRQHLVLVGEVAQDLAERRRADGRLQRAVQVPVAAQQEEDELHRLHAATDARIAPHSVSALKSGSYSDDDVHEEKPIHAQL